MTNGERAAIRRLLTAALQAGFRPVGVYDGGEMQTGKLTTMTAAEVITACASVDDSHIHFLHVERIKHHRAWARIILGNASDGSEVIADNSITPGFAEAIDALTA